MTAIGEPLTNGVGLPVYEELPVHRGGSLAPTEVVREYPLAGGRAGGTVSWRGTTIRRPVVANSSFAHEALGWLHGCSVPRVPRSLGVDGQHRWVLSFVPGRPVAVGDFDTHLACSLGALLSEIHSVGRAFETEVRDEVPWWVRTGPELGDDEFESSRGGPVGLVHGDAGIWNVVVDQGEAALVDFECCHIGRQLWELALSALSLVDPRRVGGSIELVRALVTGYGGEVGDGWDALLVERARSAVDVIWSGASNGEEPWASMAVDGTGAWWADVERVVAHGSFTSAR